MEIRPINRAALPALAIALLVAVEGCNTARMVSNPQPTVAKAEPKKQYDWQDMSTGRSFFRPINQAPKD